MRLNIFQMRLEPVVVIGHWEGEWLLGDDEDCCLWVEWSCHLGCDW